MARASNQKPSEAGQEKRPPGRPSEFKEEYCAQAVKLCRLGATDKDLADFFGKAVSTISLWKTQHPEFSDALKKGKAVSDSKVADSLYRRACGWKHKSEKIFQYEGCPVTVPFIEKFPPDTVACIFWLKNRRPDLWRDKHDVEHISNAEPDPIGEDDEKALRAYIQKLDEGIKGK